MRTTGWVVRAVVAGVAIYTIAAPDALLGARLTTPTASQSDALSSGESLYPGQSKTSSNGQYALVYQYDGNLVLSDNDTPVWHSDTAGTSAGEATMQGDGNFVIYSNGSPIRASNTDGNPGAWLAVQNDGNVVIYGPGGNPLWDRYNANWSGGPPPPPPQQNKYVLLINGSFTSTPAGWSSPGSPEYNAVQATYGVAPWQWDWTSNSLSQVIPPSYSGIWAGGLQLADFLASLPAGEVNIISHSHGGNVVLTSQYWSQRQIRRYIQLATPVNWDFEGWRYAIGYTVAGRCQASSDVDWVQFFGASPGQVINFLIAHYLSNAAADYAFQALHDGDYAEAFGWFASSLFAGAVADYWFNTTKYEVEGLNIRFNGYGLSHSDMHEPFVWNSIAGWCS